MAKANVFVKLRRALTKLWLAGRRAFVFIGIILIVAGGARYLFQQGDQTQANTAETEAADTAIEIAARVAGSLSTQLADAVTVIDEELARYSLESLPGRLAELPGRITGLQIARLYKPGEYTVDYAATPPVNYATVALLRMAERAQKNPKAEVHFHDKSPQLTYVHRIMQGMDLAGLLLLVFDKKIAATTLKSAPFEKGYAELSQVIKGHSPVTFSKAGDPSLKLGPPNQTMPVSAAMWRVTYWHPELIVIDAEQHPDDIRFYAAAGATLFFVFAVAGYLVYRRRKAKVEDTEPGPDDSKPFVLPRRPVAVSDDGLKIASNRLDLLEVDELPAQDGALGAINPGDAGEGEGDSQESQSPPLAPTIPLSDSIFRAYDVRGIVGKHLNAEVVYDLGRAIGSEAYDRGQQALMVGRDGRTTSPELAEALIRGLLDSGRDVVDVGRVPTPLLYFAAEFTETRSGVMVTGSHNSKEYNGLKIMLDGETLFDEKIAALKDRIESGRMESGAGTRQEMDIAAEYIRRITEEIPVALGNSLSLVVDCGNGVAGNFAPKMFRALGHDVHEIHCEIDGDFPNHPADPSRPENLADLIAAVREHGADLGLAFDGDGDRLGVVDGDGEVLWADRQLMLFARDVLAENAGATVVYDVKCSTRLKKVIEKLGGKPVMWKTGHSFMKNKMTESGALLAGEMSGHIFFSDRWYGFDDALFAGARLLEILMGFDEPPAAVFARLPAGKFTPELRIDVGEGEAERVLAKIKETYSFDGAKVIDIDGIRIEYPNGWAIIRPSNTEPCLVVRCEGDDDDALTRVEAIVKQALEAAGADIVPPF